MLEKYINYLYIIFIKFYKLNIILELKKSYINFLLVVLFNNRVNILDLIIVKKIINNI